MKLKLYILLISILFVGLSIRISDNRTSLDDEYEAESSSLAASETTRGKIPNTTKAMIKIIAGSFS